MSDDTAKWQRGLDMVEKVYGPGSSEIMKGLESEPLVAEQVNHLFGDIWALPHLSMRDKRLLVIGASSMLGRADLIAIQVAGAIVNGELTDEQLQELPLLLLFYAGAGNSTALFQGIRAAKARAKEMSPG